MLQYFTPSPTKLKRFDVVEERYDRAFVEKERFAVITDYERGISDVLLGGMAGYLYMIQVRHKKRMGT